MNQLNFIYSPLVKADKYSLDNLGRIGVSDKDFEIKVNVPDEKNIKSFFSPSCTSNEQITISKKENIKIIYSDSNYGRKYEENEKLIAYKEMDKTIFPYVQCQIDSSIVVLSEEKKPFLMVLGYSGENIPLCKYNNKREIKFATFKFSGKYPIHVNQNVWYSYPIPFNTESDTFIIRHGPCDIKKYLFFEKQNISLFAKIY